MNINKKLSYQVLNLRCNQILINQFNINNQFKIPIHLAIGHESIAVGLMNNISKNDKLVLSHRNIHYNICNLENLKIILDEFKLKNNGILNGKYGSMNLFNQKNNIVYSSSILGNNLSVAAGIALSSKYKKKNNFVFVVTGDGAIEEGAFYELLLLISSLELKMIIIVENNQWSLASNIQQRRKKIDLKNIAKSTKGKYFRFSSNNFIDYNIQLKKIKNDNKNLLKPIIIEVDLETLGGFNLTENNIQRYINYHSGKINKIDLPSKVILKNTNKDPLFYVKKFLNVDNFFIRNFYNTVAKKYL